MQRFAAVIALVCALPACGGDDCRDNGEGSCRGDYVCARNSECLPASEVRRVRITWTVRGQPASEAQCATHPDFYLLFYGVEPSDTFGYSPVPCDAGLFTIDRLPSRFVGVEIGVERSGSLQAKSFDAQGNVSFDLAP